MLSKRTWLGNEYHYNEGIINTCKVMISIESTSYTRQHGHGMKHKTL